LMWINGSRCARPEMGWMVPLHEEGSCHASSFLS
jgi:hypothetical protein